MGKTIVTPPVNGRFMANLWLISCTHFLFGIFWNILKFLKNSSTHFVFWIFQNNLISPSKKKPFWTKSDRPIPTCSTLRCRRLGVWGWMFKIMYWIPRLNFPLFQNYVLTLTTKWESIMFLTHAIKNCVLTFTTKWDFILFSRLFMEFGTSQFQFTLINFKNIRRKKQHKSVHAFRNLFRKV